LSLLTQALAFPAIILPAFIGAAVILAILFRHRHAETPWRYRDLVAAGCAALALGCAGLIISIVSRAHNAHADTAAGSTPSFEADMLVSGGNGVDLWFNDWQHPAERVPVVAGERHVYRFSTLPRDINLIRFDPTDVAGARIVIYSLTVKSGSRTLRNFGPAELKTWTLHDVSAPKEENGALEMQDSTDDPILWTALATPIRFAEDKPALLSSWLQTYTWSLGLAVAALLLLVAAYRATSDRAPSKLNQPCPQLPARYRNLLLSSWGVALVLLLSTRFTLYLQEQAADNGIGIEVDMMVSRGIGVDLWVNDWQHPAERLPVVAGQRHIYRFASVPRNISLLRLDPTDLPDARVILYGIAFRNRNQVLQQFGPVELKTWSRTNLSPPKDEDGGLEMSSLNDDPMLTTPLTLQLPGGKLHVLSQFIEAADGPFLLAIAVFLLLLLLRMTTRSGRMQALLIAAGSCAVYPVVSFVMKLDLLQPPPVTSAIGKVSYTGYDKANEYLAALCAMVICIGLAYVFARLTGRSNEVPHEAVEGLGEPVTATRSRYIWIANAAVFAMLLLNFTPNFLTVLRSMGAVVYRYHGWDDANMLAWAFMVHAGLLPFRDFWYPYSGAYLQVLPFPTNVISGVLHSVLVLWVSFAALLAVTGRRLGNALAIFGLLLAPMFLGILPGWYRYLLAVDVALLYVAVCDLRRLEWKTHLPFAAFTGYAFFFEPSQVIYAGIGIAAHTVLAVLSGLQGRGLRERAIADAQVLKQRLVYVAIPMLAGITVSLLFYAANGMLPGLWAFEKSVGDQGDYGAWPAQVSDWVLPYLQPDTVFLLMYLLTSYAVYRWLRKKSGANDPLGNALMVLCCTTFVVMQKQIVRPHGMTQIRLYPYTAALIFGLIVWRERKLAGRVVIVAFLGCILGISVHRNVVSGIYQQDIVEGPQKIAGAFEVALHRRDEIGPANATMFARSRFVGFDSENAVVDNLVQVCGLLSQDTVYVLGDASVFYPLLNQPAPYITNSYNDSPIYEQQTMVDWFHRKNPRYVIWETNPLSYDDVPHMVRLPLIYSYVVEHYQFVRAIGPYHILELIPPSQAPDLEYWRRVLGSSVDLGAIPGLARASEYAACEGDVARCDAVLVVRYPQSGAVARSKLTIDIDANFHVQFDVRPGKREYVVNLNRLWFWNSLAKSTNPWITTQDPAAQTVMEYRRERRPVLY
jgi:hypothetical protein